MEKSSSATMKPDTNEWVEIVEPKSKKRIYANLESGICARQAPSGANVRKSDEFSDLWWELYDRKTGKYYYYNSDQQKTSWTRPDEAKFSNGSGTGSNTKKILIIPVLKLQTFRKLSSPNNESHQDVEKCDAATQTFASNLVTTGTQTISQADLEIEFEGKLSLVEESESTDHVHNSSEQKGHHIYSTSCTHSNLNEHKPSIAPVDNVKNLHHLNRRQLSDLNQSDRLAYQKRLNQQDRPTNCSISSRISGLNSFVNHRSIGSDSNRTHEHDESRGDLGNDYKRHFGPPSSLNREPNKTLSIRTQSGLNNPPTLTSTFSGQCSYSTKPPHLPKTASNVGSEHKMTTNNLSHYLVREAQAMGIALISDDEVDEDEPDSDDECAINDDEDTDLRSDLNVSQDFGEDSSEGWKSLTSDRESPASRGEVSCVSTNSTSKLSSSRLNSNNNINIVPNSPSQIEATGPSFNFNNLIDDEKNPASCMSQQLDNRKLVENFKKSRQSSSFGLHDSLGRASYRAESNNAVRRIKHVADTYFSSQDRDQVTELQLRQLSALSTLPRPSKGSKDKVALTKPDVSSAMEAGYDIVEENCLYHSDTENIPSTSKGDLGTTSKKTRLSEPIQPHRSSGGHFDRNKNSRGSTFSVESFARENLTRHPKKGGLLFNRKVKWSRMISWTKNPIKQPMISSVSADLNADSMASFKLIQQYMGDRKLSISKKYRQVLAQSGISEEQGMKLRSSSLSQSGSNSHTSELGCNVRLSTSSSGNTSVNTSCTSVGMSNTSCASGNNSSGIPNIPDRLRDELAFELVSRGCTRSSLRDEIYVQLARQLTENPHIESVSWGLILMSILLNYFSPSSKFSPFLLSFLETHSHPMAKDVCLARLEKRLRQNWLSYCRKPADGKEISIVRLSITKWPQYCGVFGESLERIMEMQACSTYLKTLRLPWILTTLGEKLIETGGMETEGLFRCAADHDLIAQLRLEIDCVDFRKITDAKQVRSLLSNVQDSHVVAGLLKLFFRQLFEPVFPTNIYDLCLRSGQEGQRACQRIFDEELSNLNKDVVAYLIRLLQLLAQPDKVAQTKMDSSNLSMVWAPNLLRSPEHVTQVAGGFGQHQPQTSDGKSSSKWSITGGSSDQDNHHPHAPPGPPSTIGPSQSMIFEQTRQEMQFIRSLIMYLDTSFIEGVV